MVWGDRQSKDADRGVFKLSPSRLLLTEVVLGPSSKLLEAYRQPPAYKQYERNSKEFRRRSMEAPYNTPSASDIQPTDPVFIIRKATYKPPASDHGIASNASSQMQDHLRPPMNDRAASVTTVASSARSEYATPMTELPPDLERSLSPQQTRQEIIAAQRAALRANQKALLSANKNSQQGVDLNLQDRSTIRSSKDSTNTVRYSYVGVDGTETDISEIVHNEFRGGSTGNDRVEDGGRETPSITRDSPSAMSHTTAESYTSALTSPTTPGGASSYSNHGQMSRTTGHGGGGSSSTRSPGRSEDEEEEQVAVDSLATAPLDIDRGRDYLEESLARRSTASPAFSVSSRSTASGSINERIDRVMAKVTGSNMTSSTSTSSMASGIASALRQQTRNDGTHSSIPSHVARNPSESSSVGTFTSPAAPGGRARSGSTASSTNTPFRSPSASGTGIDALTSARSTPRLGAEAPPTSTSSTPRPVPRGHHKQSSAVSVASDTSSSARTTSPSTPATTSIGNHTTLTPSSSTRNDSSLSSSFNRVPLTYREDFGLDVLLHLVNMDAGEAKPPRHRSLTAVEALSPIEYPQVVSKEAASMFQGPKQRIAQLEEVSSVWGGSLCVFSFRLYSESIADSNAFIFQRLDRLLHEVLRS